MRALLARSCPLRIAAIRSHYTRVRRGGPQGNGLERARAPASTRSRPPRDDTEDATTPEKAGGGGCRAEKTAGGTCVPNRLQSARGRLHLRGKQIRAQKTDVSRCRHIIVYDYASRRAHCVTACPTAGEKKKIQIEKPTSLHKHDYYNGCTWYDGVTRNIIPCSAAGQVAARSRITSPRAPKYTKRCTCTRRSCDRKFLRFH